MSMRELNHQSAGFPPATAEERILHRLFRGYPGGLAARLPGGATLALGANAPEFTLIFKHPRALRKLILSRDPLQIAESYFSDQLDFEGDIYSVLAIKDYFQSLALTAFDRAALAVAALRLRSDGVERVDGGSAAHRRFRLRTPFSRKHTKSEDRRAIGFHYDVSNEFYQLWLDERMIYSCAYYEDASDSLEQAQRNKIDHICRKLRLMPGQRLLDIGCGWGALIRWAAEHYGVRAHGITLSENQYRHNQRLVREQGLDGLVSVELLDYRDVPGESVYDKIVSVGMFEHVGLRNLPLYFRTAHRLLKPGGLFLNHGITHDEPGWRRTLSTEFINRYVFPDGELDTVSNVLRVVEQENFEIHDVEALRPHYALTLREWVRRLDARKQEVLEQVPDPVYRVWRLYMAACALEFESGGLGVHQVLTSKRSAGAWTVPLTRRDVYV
jgi:cyclopropane-fatty-acyl-phospholipid synthase